MTKKIGIAKSELFFLHKCDEKKFENPDRLKQLYTYLDNTSNDFLFIEPKEISNEALEKVHSKFYISQIEEYSKSQETYKYDKDTYISKHTYSTAKLAAGSCIQLADKIMQKEVSKGFALVRPPGHHAETGRAMGFCIFNNIALTAQHLIDTYNLSRILIIDFDAHHGNGTQEIFYNSSKVLFLSIHQNNLFPFSGKGDEIGEEEGKNYNINIPVHPFFADKEYSYIFGRIIQQVTESFLPQIILVSAGFDAHINDSASTLEISDEGFYSITKKLVYYADKFADGKLLFILEGGYNCDALFTSAKYCLKALNEKNEKTEGFMYSDRVQKLIEQGIPDSIKSKWNI